MTAANAPGGQSHLTVVPPIARALPWWCRTFGHRYVSRATSVINPTRWTQPISTPVIVMCRRCGDRP